MVAASRSPSYGTVSRLLGVFAILSAGVAGGYLLAPNPFADAFFAGWVLVAVGLSFVGGIGAWTNRTALVWAAALLLTGLAIAGMMSVGLFVAPAALCLLGAALFSQLAGPRAGVREAITADPPTSSEIARKSLLGIGSVVVGAGGVYVGAFTRELFGACASETLACALEKTHWDAVAITLLGLVAIGYGSWLVWKQLYVSRVLATKQSG